MQIFTGKTVTILSSAFSAPIQKSDRNAIIRSTWCEVCAAESRRVAASSLFSSSASITAASEVDEAVEIESAGFRDVEVVGAHECMTPTSDGIVKKALRLMEEGGFSSVYVGVVHPHPQNGRR